MILIITWYLDILDPHYIPTTNMAGWNVQQPNCRLKWETHLQMIDDQLLPLITEGYIELPFGHLT